MVDEIYSPDMCAHACAFLEMRAHTCVCVYVHVICVTGVFLSRSSTK